MTEPNTQEMTQENFDIFLNQHLERAQTQIGDKLAKIIKENDLKHDQETAEMLEGLARFYLHGYLKAVDDNTKVENTANVDKETGKLDFNVLIKRPIIDIK